MENNKRNSSKEKKKENKGYPYKKQRRLKMNGEFVRTKY